MLSYQSLGIEDAERAIAAGRAAALERGRPMSFAVVDKHGDLIAAHRMDGSHARILRHCLRKAFTAAVMERPTLRFKEDLAERNGNLDEWGDPALTTLQGGLPVICDGQVVGAIGVGGGSITGDEEVARIVMEAIRCP